MSQSVRFAANPGIQRPVLLWGALLAIGVCWGLTGPVSKLAISTGHHPVGVTFWSAILGATLLTAVALLRGKRLPLSRRHLTFFLICGFLGTALPHSVSYAAYGQLPIGVIVIVLSLVPMATVLLALLLRLERPDLRRLAGLGLGAAAVLMMTLPETSLPDPDQAIWVALPVIAALAYAAENIYVATARPPGCDALTLLCGLSWGAVVLLAPVVLATKAWFAMIPLDLPELAVIANTLLHICAYFGFIWLISMAGPVFASQVGYVVTGSGVLLGILIYEESHSLWIWGALALLFAGLTLVKPKR